jgi:hypothetical protein
MTWREQDHPRDRVGRFTDKTGGGWASKASDRIGLPSAKDLLRDTPSNTDLPATLGREFEGSYGRGGAVQVRDVYITKMGGDRPDLPFAPLGHLSITGQIATDNDQDGYFRVTATQDRKGSEDDPLHWTAHIDRMHVRGGQGGGVGRELTNRFVDWFRRSGFDEVSVDPSEMGFYAWGAMGFDFADRESRQIAWQGAMSLSVEQVRDYLEYTAPQYGLDGSSLTDAQIKRMIGQYRRAATLALAGGLSYKKLTQYGRKAGQGKGDWWAGKLGLLVGGVGSGRIKL